MNLADKVLSDETTNEGKPPTNLKDFENSHPETTIEMMIDFIEQVDYDRRLCLVYTGRGKSNNNSNNLTLHTSGRLPSLF